MHVNDVVSLESAEIPGGQRRLRDRREHARGPAPVPVAPDVADQAQCEVALTDAHGARDAGGDGALARGGLARAPPPPARWTIRQFARLRVGPPLRARELDDGRPALPPGRLSARERARGGRRAAAGTRRVAAPRASTARRRARRRRVDERAPRPCGAAREKTRPYLPQAGVAALHGRAAGAVLGQSRLFELENRTRAGPRAGRHVRIRHLLSGRYLAAGHPPARCTTRSTSRRRAVGAALRAAPRPARLPVRGGHGRRRRRRRHALLPAADGRDARGGRGLRRARRLLGAHHHGRDAARLLPLLETGGVSERRRDIAGCHLASAGPEHQARPATRAARARLPGADARELRAAFVEHKRGEPRPTPFEVLEVEEAEATARAR